MQDKDLNLIPLLKSGAACFLVRYYKDDEKKILLDYLKKNDYQWIIHSSALPRGQWFFININSKVARVGIVGIGIVSEVVGNHAISVDDFITISNIYNQYNSIKFIETK